MSVSKKFFINRERNATISLMSDGLYIHIPFCRKKCPYCSFAVCVARTGRLDDYLSALRREMAALSRPAVRTIYLGGGTPSLLSPEQLKRLRESWRECFDCGEVAETTIEVNPEDMSPEKAEAFMSLGMTRVSVGIQSFQEKNLKALGRRHSPDAARRAVQYLQKAGCRNINVDLMFGLPGQEAEDLDADLQAILNLEVQHVSLYALTVEPCSCFYVQRVEEKDGEVQARFYEQIIAKLASAGFIQYEVSNFSRPGYESRHNVNYWQGGNYFGVGMAAHSHRDGCRSWNVDRLDRYLQVTQAGGSPRAGEERLAPPQRLSEALVFGLRMTAGVDLPGLEERFGVSFSREQRSQIEMLIQNGFLERQGPTLRATLNGRKVLDSLSVRLL